MQKKERKERRRTLLPQPLSKIQHAHPHQHKRSEEHRERNNAENGERDSGGFVAVGLRVDADDFEDEVGW